LHGSVLQVRIVDNRRLAFLKMTLSDLDPIPRNTLRAHVAERLRTAILAGDIPPGAPLVETALSERPDAMIDRDLADGLLTRDPRAARKLAAE